MLADPRLGLSDEAVRRIAEVAVPDGCAFINEVAPFPLTAETVDGQMRLRAATGDEVTDLLTTGDGASADGINWPGDPATPTGREIEWQVRHDEPPSFEPGCLLWSGEILQRSGEGAAGPFYVHRLAARAWAFSTLFSRPEGEVFEAQVVPYACACSVAPKLIHDGEAEYRCLRRLPMSPVRPWGTPEVVWRAEPAEGAL